MAVQEQDPDVIVAEARQMLNTRVQELAHECGIYMEDNISIGHAVNVINWLNDQRVGRVKGDDLILAMANWHDACLLTQYLDRKTAEFKRDFDKPGVYVIIELIRNVYVPRFIEAVPVYVGMSTMLSQRLRMHASGRGSNPAEHVTEDYLWDECTEDERAAYENANPKEQQEIRQLCIGRRKLWVKTTHTENLTEARKLEKAVTRLYESQGIALWNKMKYKTTPPWPAL